MRKIVFLMPLDPEYGNKIMEVAPDWELIQGKDSSAWLPHLKDAEIIVGWNGHAARECLSPQASLRWVHAWGAGVDSMPFDELKRKGIVLTNSSGVHPYPISETIFAMMLAFTRRIHVYVRNQREKKWDHSSNVLELHGKTVGILGVGAIGKETARLAKAFGMEVLGFRRSGEPLEDVDKMYDLHGLGELLSKSDYVVNTLPLTKETYRLIGREQFEAMKPTAFYINIGRGKTTDTDAMIRALRENEVAGAGLDVFEEEPLSQSSLLWDLDNVIIAPHTSGATGHYNDRAIGIFLDNFRSYLNGQQPAVNRVDLDKQY